MKFPEIPSSFTDNLKRATKEIEKNGNKPVKQLEMLNNKLTFVKNQLDKARQENLIRDEKNRKTQWRIGIVSAILGAFFGSLFTFLFTIILEVWK